MENIFINFIVIFITSTLVNVSITKKKIMLFSAIYAIFAIVNIQLNLNTIIVQILLNNIILYFLFKEKNIVKYIKILGCYYLTYCVNMACIIFVTLVLNINITNSIFKYIAYVFSSIMCYQITKNMWKMWISKIKLNKLRYKIKIEGETFELFLDTGNSVKYRDYNVIILDEKKYIKRKLNNYIDNKKRVVVDIAINTANGRSIEKGILYENIVIENDKVEYKFNKIIVIFMDLKIKNGLDGLMSYDTYLERLGGTDI